MKRAHGRHDISDRTWVLMESHLMERKGTWGGNARDNRQFINAVVWILRTGAPWRDLRQTSATGRTPSAASAGGATRGLGRGCWRCCFASRTTSG
jgi:transposase